MKKGIFKKILHVIDELELYGIHYEEMIDKTFQTLLSTNHNTITYEEVTTVLQYLKNRWMIHIGEYGIDLKPAVTIFIRSEDGSNIESLAFFEMNLAMLHHKDFITKIIHEHKFMNFSDFELVFGEFGMDIITQTQLINLKQGMVMFNERLYQSLQAILMEHQRSEYLISPTLMTYYITSIVNLNTKLRNGKLAMVPYSYRDVILQILPQKGIPSDREETKALQSFYKDTLFYEFHHECPICHANLPHMLIASHIKPFRDCAHIFETMDHHNGILLCRNHDYLFDQGYISFENDGTFMISPYLKSAHGIEKVYQVMPDYQLPVQYMNEERKLFLAYHRAFIFKK